MALTVTGNLATVTGITDSGGPGAYSLSATVAGIANRSGLSAPSGRISFVDTSKANTVLGAVSFGSGTSSLGFLVASSPSAGF